MEGGDDSGAEYPPILVFIMSFIQWNMRGLQANREELSLLLSQYDPTAVCIQETLLHSNKTASLKNIHTVMIVCLFALMIVLLVYCVLSIVVILINIILVMCDVEYYYYSYSIYVATLYIELDT